MLGVNGTHPFNSWGDKPAVAGTAEEIAQALPASAWARLSAGEGTKGPRLHDWAYLELVDLEAAEYGDGLFGLWTRGLLRIPTKPAGHSNLKPATYSETKPASVPI